MAWVIRGAQRFLKEPLGCGRMALGRERKIDAGHQLSPPPDTSTPICLLPGCTFCPRASSCSSWASDVSAAAGQVLESVTLNPSPDCDVVRGHPSLPLASPPACG